jgi:hypothetical protein
MLLNAYPRVAGLVASPLISVVNAQADALMGGSDPQAPNHRYESQPEFSAGHHTSNTNQRTRP